MLLDFAAELNPAPAITYGWEELSETDAPNEIRWRARWDSNYSTALPGGIFMECYPVVRKTYYGAWIDPHAYRQATKQPWEEGAPAYEWVLSHPSLHRFVYDKSGASWAKPTRALALHSLGIRLTRWSAKVRRDTQRVNAACDVAEALLSCKSWADAPEYTPFGPRSEARRHKVRLVDDDSALSVALRRLQFWHRAGKVAPEHVEAVLAAYEGHEHD
jgi:hypothetical protein